MDVEFEKTRTISDKWNVSRIISRLYEWDCNMLRIPLVIAEHGVVVATTGYQYRKSQLDTRVWSNFRFPFYKISVQKQ